MQSFIHFANWFADMTNRPHAVLRFWGIFIGIFVIAAILNHLFIQVVPYYLIFRKMPQNAHGEKFFAYLLKGRRKTLFFKTHTGYITYRPFEKTNIPFTFNSKLSACSAV